MSNSKPEPAGAEGAHSANPQPGPGPGKASSPPAKGSKPPRSAPRMQESLHHEYKPQKPEWRETES